MNAKITAVSKSRGILAMLELTTEREARIQRWAHELWERAGAPAGQDVLFWTQAAGEIDSEDRTGMRRLQASGNSIARMFVSRSEASDALTAVS